VKSHPQELRQLAISKFRSCDNVALLAREMGIPRQTLYRWIDESECVEVAEDGELVSAAKNRESRLRKRISQLKHALANKTLEVDFFKGALQKVRARHRNGNVSGEWASTITSGV
jgi:transposase-like protein